MPNKIYITITYIHNKKNYNIIKKIIKKDLFHNYNTKLLKISNIINLKWNDLK